MLMLIYTFIAMAVTPIAYEYLNRRLTASGKLQNIVKGWPAYIINVIVCGVFAVGGVLLSADRSVWNWIVLTALIYFGNQFVFQSVVKPWFKSRTGKV